MVLTLSPGESIALTLPDGRMVRVVYLGRHYWRNPATGVLHGREPIGVECDRDIPIFRAELLAQKEASCPLPQPQP